MLAPVVRRGISATTLASLRGFHSTIRSANKHAPYYSPESKLSSETLIGLENTYAARNYSPLPVVFSKAQGINVWDPEGKQYMDFLSAYSAVNQGHCHPKIIEAAKAQMERVTLSSRAFYNDMFPRFAKFVTEYFGYEMVLPMNTGAEAVETSLKLARKWGYLKKGIPTDRALIVSASECFHGRTLGIISMSDDPDAQEGFGPFLPGLRKVPFNDVHALEQLFAREGEHIAGLLLEPIQGEAGVVVPDEGYLKACRDLCTKYNVLLIADEVQSGIGRTGKLLAVDWDNIRPDLVILGKALAGGVYPVSCVLADKEVMLCIQPGQHGSTYGGNPLGCAVSIAALQVLRDENLVENALERGYEFQKFGSQLHAQYPDLIHKTRGRGLFNAFVVNPDIKNGAKYICLEMKDRGVLAKPTHEHIIRFAPPLCITKDQLAEGMSRIAEAVAAVASHV